MQDNRATNRLNMYYEYLYYTMTAWIINKMKNEKIYIIYFKNQLKLYFHSINEAYDILRLLQGQIFHKIIMIQSNFLMFLILCHDYSIFLFQSICHDIIANNENDSRLFYKSKNDNGILWLIKYYILQIVTLLNIIIINKTNVQMMTIRDI